MADKSTNCLPLLSRSCPICFFTITTLLFIFSWFFMESTDKPQFINMPNKQLIPLIPNENIPSQDQNSDQPLNIPNTSSANEEDASEEEEKEFEKCSPSKAMLKVYMYDMPPEFHFGLLDWKPQGRNVWPDLQSGFPHYPGGLNQQHSIEYWLTLDILSSRSSDRIGPCNAIRIDNSSEADVIFVPFFSSLSYNKQSKVKPPPPRRSQGRTTPDPSKDKNKILQDKLVAYLMNQGEWKRSDGRDHVIVAHHPNSLLEARMTVWPAILILSDFGRYPPIIANVEKDVIAPYKHVITTFVNDSSGYDDRPILMYFQGAIYRKDGGYVRQELYQLLKDERDVHFAPGSVSRNGTKDASQGMHSSKFCLNIAGDTPSSNRLFDAVASHCVPVVISDEIELPYEDILDYTEFSLFVRTSDALREGFLMKLIRSIGKEEWTKMWQRLKEVEHHFEFQYPSQKDDAVQMIWKVVASKVSAVRLKVHKSNRYALSDTRNPNRSDV